MQPAAGPRSSQGANRLGLLYQHILTGVVRIQSGQQKIADIETLRRRMKGALDQAEREASLAGYDAASIREASFAVVALLDETISSSKEPSVNVWQKRPLNIELYGQAIAGDVFFERLHELESRPDSSRLIDVLEVYLLCLLLGFEGRFAPPLRGEAHRIMERLRLRIEAARESDYRLSPPIKIRSGSSASPRKAAYPWYLPAGGVLMAAILLFILYSLDLGRLVDELTAIAASVPAAL
jgi:type VI secretion system protein ImpK